MTIDLAPAHTFTLRLFVALRAACEQHKQRELATVMGVSEARVCQMLQGGQNLTIETVARLLAAVERLNKDVK